MVKIATLKQSKSSHRKAWLIANWRVAAEPAASTIDHANSLD
jgi:hypothetical protein